MLNTMHLIAPSGAIGVASRPGMKYMVYRQISSVDGLKLHSVEFCDRNASG